VQGGKKLAEKPLGRLIGGGKECVVGEKNKKKPVNGLVLRPTMRKKTPRKEEGKGGN